MNNLSVSETKTQALELHQRILSNGYILATTLVEFCRELKEMRDKELFKELEYDSFDDYIETAVGLKSRQAYNYIATYETWGPKLLEQNAGLGITKLEILRHLPATDREEILAEKDMTQMSAKEVKELVEKLNNCGEQIDLLKQEAADADETAQALQQELDLLKSKKEKADTEDIEKKQAEIERLNKLLDEIKKQPIDVNPAPAVDIEKIKADAIKTTKKEYEKQIASAEKSNAEALEKIKATAEAEKAAALLKATEFEKRLQLAQSEESTAFALHFDLLQQSFNKMLDLVDKLNQKGQKEQATKLGNALKNALANLVENFEV